MSLSACACNISHKYNTTRSRCGGRKNASLGSKRHVSGHKIAAACVRVEQVNTINGRPRAPCARLFRCRCRTCAHANAPQRFMVPFITRALACCTPLLRPKRRGTINKIARDANIKHLKAFACDGARAVDRRKSTYTTPQTCARAHVRDARREAP